MKVILVNGSPKEKGCTYTALLEVAGALEQNGVETEIFWIGNKPISGCIDCRVCRTGATAGKGCPIDKLVNNFAEIAEGADGFVFGSPVHYAGASGGITSFMDRLFFAHGHKFKCKPACAVMSLRRGGASATFDQLNKYFTICQMPIITSNYWNMVHGNTPDQVKKDTEGLQTMRILGNNMAWILKCIQVGKDANINFPEGEKKIYMNYIRD